MADQTTGFVRLAEPGDGGGRSVPKGYRLAWFEVTESAAGNTWMVATLDQMQRLHCRHSLKTRCQNPIAVVIRRGKSWTSWPYCKEHMFGRRIEAGRIIELRLIEEDPRA